MTNTIEWAQRIAAIANTGLYYVKDDYDRDRYGQLLDIATDMLSSASDADPAALRPLLSLDDGYITPKVDVRGAVFHEGKVLLVQEAGDGLWSLPGGWADVGDTPSGAVEREIHEESGYQARAVKLMAVDDRNLRNRQSIFGVYKLFFLCQLTGGEAKTSNESLAVDWFAPDDLPPLSQGRVTAAQMERWFRHWRQPDLPTEFD